MDETRQETNKLEIGLRTERVSSKIKPWLRWTLIITQVGGGFTGIAVFLEYLNDTGNRLPIEIVMVLGLITLYAYVVIAGALFALDERRISPLRAALWLQVPWISSPIIAWHFSTGLCLNVYIVIGGNSGLEYWLGSTAQFHLFEDLPWGIGINLFPTLMLFLLRRKKVQQAATFLSIPAQIDSILHARLQDSPLEDRDISLEPLSKGEVLEMVGSDKYASIGEVPYEEFRTLTKSAIAEWENSVNQASWASARVAM